jgi:hypothetical protein
LLLCHVRPAQAQSLPRSRLAVEVDGRWHGWWRSDQAPAQWRAGHPTVLRAARWRPVAAGVEWGELRLAGRGEAWRLRVILLRIDPAHVAFRLVESTRDYGTLGAWTVEQAAPDALVGLNTGHFSGGQPWGWLVRGASETQAPGFGPLSMALVGDTAGTVALVPADSIAAARERGGVRWAFQSYPTLLVRDGEVPPPLRAPGLGVDVGHRDSRLAIGELRDGRLLIALTRFEGLGGVLDRLPFGPTTPELAALMGALGSRKAVALDGGISGQLLLRGPDGSVRAWPGMRRVPLGMELYPRRHAGR